MARRKCIVYALPGLTNYETAWRYQRVLAEHINHQKKACVAGKASWPADHLLLLQHPRIFTLGRGSTPKNIKFSLNERNESPLGTPEVVRVERGGEVTWHGPGQLVAYPILDLNNDRPGGDSLNAHNVHKKDLHWYTRQLEQTVIDLLQGEPYKISGVGRHKVNTGVWVSRADTSQGLAETHCKISAIGVTASRWTTMHGLSLNVCPDMSDYSLIVPCGIEPEQLKLNDSSNSVSLRFGVCSMQQLEPLQKLDVDTVRKQYEKVFGEVFGLDLERPPDALETIEGLLEAYPTVTTMQLARGTQGLSH
jgi:lipoyl(octanoyl) transferase